MQANLHSTAAHSTVSAVLDAVWIIMIVAIIVCASGIGFLIWRTRRNGGYASEPAVSFVNGKQMEVLQHF
jgi:hypothetical protein